MNARESKIIVYFTMKLIYNIINYLLKGINMNKIPAGYRFSFLSYDLRHNNEKIIIKEGLNENEANLFSQLAEYIQGGLGIELDDTPAWRETSVHNNLLKIMESYPTIFNEDEMNNFKSDLGIIRDFISENILGYEPTDYIKMRFLESYKIEDIPQDIPLKDVTYNFKNKHKM